MSEERWGVYIPIVTAAMALLGGFGGGYVNHLLTSAREQHANLFELRSAAYAEFFRGQALLWSGAGDEAQLAEANETIDNAKLQIVMASSSEVISAMDRYWQRYASDSPCDPPEKFEEDAEIYQSIRSEAFALLDLGDPEIAPDVLVRFLFGCQLPGASQAAPGGE